MGPVERSLKTIPFLKRGVFKEMGTCSLPHIYPVIFPRCKKTLQRHEASVKPGEKSDCLVDSTGEQGTDCLPNLSSTNSVVPVDLTSEGGVCSNHPLCFCSGRLN